MTTLIFRTTAPIIAAVTAAFSLILLLRGHNDPGGGFIAGLLAASAVAGLDDGRAFNLIAIVVGHGYFSLSALLYWRNERTVAGAVPKPEERS